MPILGKAGYNVLFIGNVWLPSSGWNMYRPRACKDGLEVCARVKYNLIDPFVTRAILALKSLVRRPAAASIPVPVLPHLIQLQGPILGKIHVTNIF